MSTGSRVKDAGGGLLMVYGAGVSAIEEERNTEHRMTVHAAQLDSTYEFGHIPEGGGFERLVDFPGGTFRVRGGDIRRFAIRSLDAGTATITPRTVEFSGPAMSASRAIAPPMDEPYYSIATLLFLPSRSDTVTVELLTSSPNGFSGTK
ncbi:MAG: hypothetical protein IH969_06830 [Candidatus Krumholzibacteriota bacterium]|nr:hypothetical protein [Candidatus Krumholzibacteriota bacterium]